MISGREVNAAVAAVAAAVAAVVDAKLAQ